MRENDCTGETWDSGAQGEGRGSHSREEGSVVAGWQLGQAYLHSGTRRENQFDKWKKSQVQGSGYLWGKWDVLQPFP